MGNPFPISIDFSSGLPNAVANDLIISENVGFVPLAVAIDNYTAYWIYFPDADAFVPPFWGGVVLGLNHANSARAQLLSPLANPQAPVDPSYRLHTVWSDTPSPFSGGSALAGGPSTPSITVIDDFTFVFLSTIVNLTGVPQPLPAISMPNRTSLMLQAPYSNNALVYIGGINVTPDQTATGGVQIYPGQSIPIEAGATAIVYGVQDPLQPVQQIIVMEGR